MSAVTQTDPDFVFRDPARFEAVAAGVPAHPAGTLGPLAQLPGTWKGHGFNTIWRPHHGGQDRFLELNLTTETLSFSTIKGAIPNRGLLTPDIEMFGLTYMQQISETASGAGLHIEPGIWAHVPATSNPSEPLDRGEDGLDPARDRDPRPGHHPVPRGWAAAYPREQHHPVPDRQLSPTRLGLRGGISDLH